MAYSIFKADGTLVTVADNTIDVDYYNANANGSGKGIGVQLIGRNAVSFGAAMAQNLLQITENFCGTVIPSDSTALQGQLWFNKTSSSSGKLYVRISDAVSGGINNWSELLVPDADGIIYSERLRLSATDPISLTSTLHAFQVGPDSNLNLCIDQNEIQARNNSLASTLALNIRGGTVSIGLASNLTRINGNLEVVGTVVGDLDVVGTITSRSGRVPVVNPTSGNEEDGDTRVVGSVISIWAAGQWRQVFPAIYV